MVKGSIFLGLMFMNPPSGNVGILKNRHFRAKMLASQEHLQKPLMNAK